MIYRAEALDVAGARVVTTADLLALTLRAACDPAWRRSRALRDLADIVLQGGNLLETSRTETSASKCRRPRQCS